MTDLLQVVVVTLAAAAALVVLVWPYLRTPPAGPPACANCPSAARRPRPSTVQPLELVTPTRRR